jgi:hypothetical protein
MHVALSTVSGPLLMYQLFEYSEHEVCQELAARAQSCCTRMSHGPHMYAFIDNGPSRRTHSAITRRLDRSLTNRSIVVAHPMPSLSAFSNRTDSTRTLKLCKDGIGVCLMAHWLPNFLLLQLREASRTATLIMTLSLPTRRVNLVAEPFVIIATVIAYHLCR